jgi:ABC-2 type transport system permease protein
MTIELFRLEWRRLRRDAVFWGALGLLVAILGYGLVNGFAWLRFQQQTIARADAVARSGVAAARVKAAELDATPDAEYDSYLDPRNAMGFESEFLRQYDCLAPGPLAMLGVGQSDLLPSCVRVTTGPWPSFLSNYEWENPLRLMLGRFDCAFGVIYLLPLLVLAVSFNLLSRERELGTLPLLFSYPVSPARWLGTSIAMRASLFLAAAGLALGVGLWLGGYDAALPGAGAGLGWWSASAACYAAFWFALAWLVNARGDNSALNGLTLAGAWLVLVIILPATLNLVIKQLYPLPSRMEFISALRATTEEVERTGSERLKVYLQDHPELASGDPEENEENYIRTLIAINAETERVLTPTLQRFRDQSRSQQAIIDRFGFLSPAIVFQQLANALSGTDQARHRLFMDAVEAHRAEVKQYFDPKFVAEDPFTDFGGVPPFRYRDDPLPQAVALAGRGLLLMGLPALVFAVWGGWRLRRPLFER